MSHRTTSVGVAAAIALSLAAPSAASALAGTVGKPCYTHVPLAKTATSTEPIVVTLTGGTPNANFLVSATAPGKGSGSAGSVSGTFDALGNGTVSITDVFPPSGSIDPIKGDPIAITAKDFGAGAAGVETPIATTLITNLAMDVATKPRSPRKKRKITVSGTPFAGQVLYGFVVKGTNPKILRKIKLGTADGCGYLVGKGVVAPKSFKRGTYRLYVNAGPKLNKNLALAFSFRITRGLF
ncbi:MAG TPA: hypothetical protein VL120_14440 [Solirubrobacteraceae bacterium]|jgi:hypothetical protein|nr:hypothetical protein [Solirubrobacteraceae bacterium]